MRIHDREGGRRLGECDLKPPTGPFLVIRVVNGAGEYRRLKLPAVRRPGEETAIAATPEEARLLPGFREE